MHPFRVTRYTFGDYVSLELTKSGEVAYSHESKHWLLAEERKPVEAGEIAYDRFVTDERGPFERADFGDRERLKWAGGVCAMPNEAEVSYWKQRYVMWFDGAWLCAVDATRPLVVRLALPITVGKVHRAHLHAETLYLDAARQILVVSASELEGLFDSTTGTREVHVRELYPLRRPDAKRSMSVDWVWDSKVSLSYAHGGYSLFSIPPAPGLARGVPVSLYNALAADLFLEYSTPDIPRSPLYPADAFPAEHAATCELVVEPGVDPAGALTRPSTAARVEDLASVFALLADEPDEPTARMVIVDLLEDAGEPYASTFARLLAGDDSARASALGTLASYLDDIEWLGNLPRGATLAARAPLDDEIGDLVMADHRLGFFHTLRLGEGSFRLYAKLVSSPRATGLRHADGSRAQTLKALIAANRRELRRLSNVKFANREVIEALADPTFDRLVEIETEVQLDVADRLLDYIARDEATFFARAKRHLVLFERAGNTDGLVGPVVAAWPRLPLDKLTFGGVTLSRDGTARALPETSPTVLAQVATRFRLE